MIKVYHLITWLQCSTWIYLLSLKPRLKWFSFLLCSRCRCSSQLCFPSRVSSWSPFPFIQTHLVQGLASSSLWLEFLPTISLLYGTRNPSGSEECQVRLLSSFRTFERLCCRKPISVYIYDTQRWIKYAKVYCAKVGYGDGMRWVERWFKRKMGENMLNENF